MIPGSHKYLHAFTGQVRVTVLWYKGSHRYSRDLRGSLYCDTRQSHVFTGQVRVTVLCCQGVTGIHRTGEGHCTVIPGSHMYSQDRWRSLYYDTRQSQVVTGNHRQTQTNIWIYSDATLCTEQISEYIWMEHIYWTNILIYSYSGNRTIRIQIIFKGHFIRIFEYSNKYTHHWLKEFFKRLTHASSN